MRIAYENELYHYGVLGQKWGVRRYQNEDGTLTNAGKEHKQNAYDNRPVSRQRNISGTGKTVSKGSSVNAASSNRPVGRQNNKNSYYFLSKPLDQVVNSSVNNEKWSFLINQTSNTSLSNIDLWYKKEIEDNLIQKENEKIGDPIFPIKSNQKENISSRDPNLNGSSWNRKTQKNNSSRKQNLNNSSWSKNTKKVSAPSRDPNLNGSSWNKKKQKENTSASLKKKSLSHSDELYHYGILGMRWGIRRFQNPDGTLTPAGKKRYGTAENLAAGRTIKQAAKYEKEKQEAIKSGKAELVSKFSKDLTSEELSEAVRRINAEQLLSELRVKDMATAQEKVNKMIAAGTTAKNAMILAKDVYNLSAQVINAASGDKKLPIIGEGKPKPGDQKIMYSLNKEKAADERNKWFAKELQGHNDIDYFRKNAGKFTTDEMKAVKERFDQMDSTFGKSKTDKPKETSSKESKTDKPKETLSKESKIDWPSSTDVKSSWREDVSSISVSDVSEAQDWLTRYIGR